MLSACAPALHEPARLDELLPVDAGPATSPAARIAEAESSFAERTPQAARRAVDLWLQVAAGEESRIEGLLGLTRVRVWLAAHEPQRESRLAAAAAAVESAQWCERIAPDEPACAYWLAIALGVQARERPSTGHDALKEMVRRLERAIAAAPELDHAGPHRVLAWVLLRAPGWPAGPGDADLGLQHAVNAVNYDPDYPPNQLCLGEALAATGTFGESRRVYIEAFESARRWRDAGDPDASEWLADAQRALNDLDR